MQRSMVSASDDKPAELSPCDLQTLYSGGSTQTIEGSNRIKILQGWNISGSPKTFFILRGYPYFRLVVCPVPIFHEELKRIIDEIGNDGERRNFQREFTNRCHKIILSDSGRLTIPQVLFTETRFTKKAKLVGLFDRFEIWPAERYSEAESNPPATPEYQGHIRRI